MHRLRAILLLLGGGYVVASTVMYLIQDQLIFHPRPRLADPRGENVRPIEMVRPDATLRGWLVNGEREGPVLVYFGGNAEEVSPLVDVFATLDASTVLMNYRGYGDSTGTPAAATLIEDAAAVAGEMHQRLGHERPLILFGRSLGSGIAALTCRSVDADGLILLSPYRSLTRLAEHYAPTLPVRWLLRHRIDLRTALDALPGRVLVLYSPGDHIVPGDESRALIDLLKAQRPPAQPQVVRFDGPHNAPLTDPALWPAIRRFVAGERPPDAR